MLEQKNEKYQKFLSENFHFLVVKFSVYLNRRVFVMMFLHSEKTGPSLAKKKQKKKKKKKKNENNTQLYWPCLLKKFLNYVMLPS